VSSSDVVVSLLRDEPRPGRPALPREAITLHAVLVSGISMLPTLSPGDCLLVRRPRRVRPGDVVVARFPSRPDLLVVKRAVRAVDGSDDSAGWWWVEGDNPAVTDDSRAYGPAEVLGRVVLRYWPLPPSRRLA
jgi:nickel-type superoxide dismutase maturation protease